MKWLRKNPKEIRVISHYVNGNEYFSKEVNKALSEGFKITEKVSVQGDRLFCVLEK